MRQDQYERLQHLEEKLTDVFISEAQPEGWPGAGLAPAALDQQARGDRYWCKKNAVATLSLVQRVAMLIGQVQLAGAGTTAPTSGEPSVADEARDNLDAEVKAAEKDAARLLDRLTKGTAGPKLDRKAHGKS